MAGFFGFGKNRANDAFRQKMNELEAQLAPESDMVFDRPDQDTRLVLDGVASGDHLPAVSVFAGSRASEDRLRRGDLVVAVTRQEVESRAWLDAWLAADPDSPDALMVAAERGVVDAWTARSSRRAVEVDEARWGAFRVALDEAAPVVWAAVEAGKTDPIPWMSAVTLATGYGMDRDEFDRVVQGFMNVDAANVHCHGRALNHLMPRWHGQPGEALAYGEWAAELGGPASRLQLLPIKCEFEHLVIEPSEDVTFDSVLATRRTGVTQAIDRAEAWLALEAEHDPVGARTARSYLALMHHFVDNEGRSFQHFALMGSDATKYPWAFYGAPREQLLAIRHQITVKYAKTLA